MCARCKALWCRLSPTSPPIFPPNFQNRMHWNRVVYPWGSAWSGSLWPSAERHAPAPKCFPTMAVNPNFFPNGYQDPMHPEDEVVTNWVRVPSPLLSPIAFSIDLTLASQPMEHEASPMWYYAVSLTRMLKPNLILEHLKPRAELQNMWCNTRGLYAVIFRNGVRVWFLSKNHFNWTVFWSFYCTEIMTATKI